MKMKGIEDAIKYLEEINSVQFSTKMPRFSVFRALMNITMPLHLSSEYYEVQDEILKLHNTQRGIQDIEKLKPLENNIILFQGDITTIKADAIVNACNEKLLGCFQPLHSCIDNAIHSFAGLQVRRDLMEIMKAQGYDEGNGKCKVTKGYNLPSTFIFHTVGPKTFGIIKEKDKEDLKNCYLSCLAQADELQLKSIVFCSIATGLYGFPIEIASKIAVTTVKKYLEEHKSSIQKVMFNVFSEGDYDVYYRRITEANN